MGSSLGATVCLTFDFDAISGWLDPSKPISPCLISRGEFGAVAAPRILDMLDHFGIRTSWFVPGHTADTYPGLVKEVCERGHEIAHHGYCHESPVGLSLEEERRILERGTGALERVTGKRPSGYRSPSWDLSPNTVGLLLEHGFVYDSSLMGNDFTPYWCRRGDRYTFDQAYHFGEAVELVEMPVTWGLDDFPAFEFVSLPHQVYPGLRSPSQVLEIWAGDFDYMVANVPGGVYVLTLHPQVIGRGHRLLMLERLITHIREVPGVRFERMIDFVLNWKRQAQPAS